MEKRNFFNIPTQICFYDPWDKYETNKVKLGGIAYKDKVICGCCGGIFDISDIEILEIYKNWVSLSEEIIGD